MAVVHDEAAPWRRVDLAVVVSLVYCAAAALGLTSRQIPHLAWGISLLGAIAVLQVMHCRQSHGGRRPRSWPATVALQALLTFVPVFFLGPYWVGSPGLLAASVLLFLRPRWRWPGWATVIAGQFIIMWPLYDMPEVVIYFSVGAVVPSLGVFSLTRLTDLLGQLRAARSDLARLAVAYERERVAADLHDVLGYSLMAIASKGERSHALTAGDDPGRAREEIATLLDLSRQALDDVRVIAQRYRVRSDPP
jgi:two-component system sensor histidine kinase DesK